ncbi:hypothetical protein B6N60_01694 [Richelia sinica FACHB-800]|uniref:Uncharacterized protein n=1 Tax=Richelia sinica FACHB-800 TaxID=1357546 RepID=A0A975T7V0_9NOST|nr:hypothetical protein B6N60_01694 [Richelia sinica FACHB-800]
MSSACSKGLVAIAEDAKDFAGSDFSGGSLAVMGGLIAAKLFIGKDCLLPPVTVVCLVSLQATMKTARLPETKKRAVRDKKD